MIIVSCLFKTNFQLKSLLIYSVSLSQNSRKNLTQPPCFIMKLVIVCLSKKFTLSSIILFKIRRCEYSWSSWSNSSTALANACQSVHQKYCNFLYIVTSFLSACIAVIHCHRHYLFTWAVGMKTRFSYNKMLGRKLKVHVS